MSYPRSQRYLEVTCNNFSYLEKFRIFLKAQNNSTLSHSHPKPHGFLSAAALKKSAPIANTICFGVKLSKNKPL